MNLLRIVESFDSYSVLDFAIILFHVSFLKAIQAAGKTTDIRKMMNTFILQMGYPVVTITKSSKLNTYVASQSRFLYYQPPTTRKRSVESPYK